MIVSQQQPSGMCLDRRQPAPAALFGGVHGVVRTLDQGVDGFGIIRHACDTDAHGQGDGFSFLGTKIDQFQVRPDLVGEMFCSFMACSGQDQHEFVPAVPSCDVRFADERCERRRDQLEGTVSRCMAVAIVDLLEVVHVAQDQ
jgi:hypothetical protein